ncbi:MAG: hypothetical protein Q27BPR15_12400 [Rhodobacter sp. CACIA14H1]|nr:MAG: hypothetical protein Q27BPR15_12400 [Rhodobacter sp. CACIA14H1]
MTVRVREIDVCMSLRLGIGRIREEHNTALYFERAALAAGHEVVVVHEAHDLVHAGQLDMFIVVDPWFHGMQVLPRLSCPTAAVLIDVHLDLPTRAMFSRFFDHVFVAQRDLVVPIAAKGHNSVQWLPLGGDPSVHFVPNITRDIDVGFVGKMGTPGTDRHSVLSRVLPRFGTNQIDRSYTPWEMGRIYSRSRIVFNKSIGRDVNMRVFEALAAGALLVTDRISNGLDDLMTEGKHYIGYDTAEEAIAQIEHYLADEEARARIARAGQALMNERHSYGDRLTQILRTVQAAGDARPAPARHVTPGQQRLWRAEWARRRGISATDAAGLMAEGLTPAGYGHLAIGLARTAKWMMTGLGRTRS